MVLFFLFVISPFLTYILSLCIPFYPSKAVDRQPTACFPILIQSAFQSLFLFWNSLFDSLNFPTKEILSFYGGQTVLIKCIYICLHVQAKYCSEECRQSAWDQYHRTLCLGENEGDPSHPFEQLHEAWRLLQYTMWKFELFYFIIQDLLCRVA